MPSTFTTHQNHHPLISIISFRCMMPHAHYHLDHPPCLLNLSPHVVHPPPTHFHHFHVHEAPCMWPPPFHTHLSFMHARRHTHFLLIPVFDSRYHHHAHNSISFFHRFPRSIPSLATRSLHTHHYSHPCSTGSVMKVVSCLSINNAAFIMSSFSF